MLKKRTRANSWVFYQQSEFLFKMFIKSALYLSKRPKTGNQKQLSSKANVIFLDIIMLIMLAKFEFDTWFHFFQKQGIIKKTVFSLKPDDVIVMSSNVHEWKGKPRSIVWYQ